jgi:hypothetical protein
LTDWTSVYIVPRWTIFKWRIYELSIVYDVIDLELKNLFICNKWKRCEQIQMKQTKWQNCLLYINSVFIIFHRCIKAAQWRLVQPLNPRSYLLIRDSLCPQSNKPTLLRRRMHRTEATWFPIWLVPMVNSPDLLADFSMSYLTVRRPTNTLFVESGPRARDPPGPCPVHGTLYVCHLNRLRRQISVVKSQARSVATATGRERESADYRIICGIDHHHSSDAAPGRCLTLHQQLRGPHNRRGNHWGSSAYRRRRSTGRTLVAPESTRRAYRADTEQSAPWLWSLSSRRGRIVMAPARCDGSICRPSGHRHWWVAAAAAAASEAGGYDNAPVRIQ